MLMPPAERPARLFYLANGYRMLVAGDHVVCAVTGRAIPLDRLRYWSVDRQEPYADASAALGRMIPA